MYTDFGKGRIFLPSAPPTNRMSTKNMPAHSRARKRGVPEETSFGSPQLPHDETKCQSKNTSAHPRAEDPGRPWLHPAVHEVAHQREEVQVHEVTQSSRRQGICLRSSLIQ